jgi:quinohemoprotein amine dehydrogenase
MRVIKLLALAVSPLAFCLWGFVVHSQTPAPSPEKPKEPPKELVEEGVPVTDALVIGKCASCHKKDEKSRLTRISYERRTPEGWQQVIKRMVRLNGLTLSPEDARSIVKYLSNHHGLAPEEAKPAMYQAEHRILDETIPDEQVRTACTVCHNYGRIRSQRRSKEEWDLLVNMHAGYFPVVEFQGFRRFPPPPDAPPPPPGTDTRHPADRAVEYLAKNFPLQTPEWNAWRANWRSPKIAGRWLITGSQIGRGRVYGVMEITPTSVEDEFTTKTRLLYVQEKTVVTRNGRSIVYSGYSWRGRSFSDAGAAASSNAAIGAKTDPKELREVMFVSRDWAQMEGRWFWGDYEEFGLDLNLRRIDEAPVLAGLDRRALRSPSTGEQITIVGANLPTDLKPEVIDLGPGVKVKRIINATAEGVVVEVDVDATAAPGRRDIAVGRSFAQAALTIYDKVDYIKINPDNALARLGGVVYPKGYQQFEAIGWNRGPDNKPQTPDDIDLGPIDVEWSIEEFPSNFDDDDKNFIGALSKDGFFSPAVEGPNPKRKFNRNNYGEVWVVASYKPKDAAKDARPMTARCYLVVTVPLYVKWDQPEVAR